MWCSSGGRRTWTWGVKRPSPVEVGSLSGLPHYLRGVLYIPGGYLGFLNHQQYHQHLPEVYVSLWKGCLKHHRFFLAALKWYKWWYGTCDKLSINSLWFDPDPVPFHHILVIRDIFFQVAHASTNGKWVVWGPVVWNSKKIPLWRGWGFLGGNPNSNPKPHIYHYLIHSGRSTWNLQIHPFREENHLNQTIIFSFDSFIFGGVKAGKNCSWPIHHYTPQV